MATRTQRVPAGVPTGGQFAASTHDEAAAVLTHPTTIDDDRALAVALISDMGLDDLPPEWWEKTTWRRGDMNAKLLEAASRLIFIASTEDGADEYDLDGVADRVSCLNEIRYRGC